MVVLTTRDTPGSTVLDAAPFPQIEPAVLA